MLDQCDRNAESSAALCGSVHSELCTRPKVKEYNGAEHDLSTRVSAHECSFALSYNLLPMSSLILYLVASLILCSLLIEELPLTNLKLGCLSSDSALLSNSCTFRVSILCHEYEDVVYYGTPYATKLFDF